MIPTQVQANTAVAIAIAFQRYILEVYHQPMARLSETLNSYARSVLPSRKAPIRPRRSCSLSPPRILTSDSATRPPMPLDTDAASFYRWSMRLLLRLHLEPSTEALSRLLNATDRAENPLATFLILELQLRQSPRPQLAADREACQALLKLASSGHFALAIEAFSRLSICQEGKKSRNFSSSPCEDFMEFIFYLLRLDKAEAANESFVWQLWERWRMRWWNGDVKNAKSGARGPVLEAFLGATMNACIACVGEDRKHPLLSAVISTILAFVLANHPHQEPQAVWLLGKLLKTGFWVEQSFPSRDGSSVLKWWQQPILKIFHSSALVRKVAVKSSTADETVQGFSSQLAHQYRNLMTSSWAEGLSTLIPGEGIRHYLGLTASTFDGDEEAGGTLGFSVIQDLLRHTPEDDGDVFWLIAYLIGAECNSVMFEEYNLWDEVLDAVAWNSSTILPNSSGSGDGTNRETGILAAFVG